MPQDEIPIEEQANVPGGLMSLDPGTIPGQRPPNFGKSIYSRLAEADGHWQIVLNRALAWD